MCFQCGFSTHWDRPSFKMDMTPIISFGNVTEEVFDSTTDADILVVVVQDSKLWYLCLTIILSVLTFLIGLITTVILIHHYKWALEERQARSQGQDIELHTVKSVESESGGSSGFHALEEGQIQSGSQRKPSDTDSFLTVVDEETFHSCVEDLW